MSDEKKHLSEEELHQIDGGKALSRRTLDDGGEIVLDPSPNQHGGAIDHVTDEELGQVTGGKAIARRSLEDRPVSDGPIADGDGQTHADPVWDPPTAVE